MRVVDASRARAGHRAAGVIIGGWLDDGSNIARAPSENVARDDETNERKPRARLARAYLVVDVANIVSVVVE